MTKEEIEQRVLELKTGAICHCWETADCKRHRELLEFARSLVSQALEVAAQTVSGLPSLPHHDMVVGEGHWEGYEEACRDAEKRIRALKPS